VACEIARSLANYCVVVEKSTVPVYTNEWIRLAMERNGASRKLFDVVSNPEFLREGSALRDFMQPDRVVIGAHNREAAERVAALYAPLEAPVLLYDIYTAEMVKYASNSFLAARISFINEISRICERVGADAKLVAEGMGLDHRIGPHFLEAGIGYGGSCFPKDVKALTAIAERFDLHPALLTAVIDINRDQRMLAVDKLAECVGDLSGTTIGMLGLSFKPNTDDMREAPSIDIAKVLLARGARVRAYDPAAIQRAKELMPDIEYLGDAYAVADGADGVVVVTEWNEFRQLDLERLQRSMRKPVLIDGRNIYDPQRMRALGFTYRGVGRN
jgi:UDPglucose 6-dehydrogenase